MLIHPPSLALATSTLGGFASPLRLMRLEFYFVSEETLDCAVTFVVHERVVNVKLLSVVVDPQYYYERSGLLSTIFHSGD